MTDIAPVVANYPSSATAFTNKYTPTGQYQGPSAQSLIAALNALPTPTAVRPRAATTANVISPLALYDLTRANRGLSPLTPRQSAAALRTLTTGRPATPPRRESGWRAAVSDLRNLVTSIPKLPGALYREATQLPQVPSLISRTVADSSNPIQALGNVASLPGVRFVPGAFVAQQLAADPAHGGEGVQGLLAHPLFTALDILPVASGLARTTKVSRAARDAYMGQIESLTAARRAIGYDPSTAVIPRAPRPLTTALTRTLTPTGEVIPNALGRGLTRAREAVISTNFGNTLQQAFGERLSSRLANRANTFLGEAAIPEVPSSALRPNIPGGLDAIPEAIAIRDMGADIQTRLKAELANAGMDEATFYRTLTTSRTADGLPIPPEQMLTLTPELRDIARATRDFWAKSAAYTDVVLPGPHRTQTLLIDGAPETFDFATARRISGAQRIEASTREILEARRAALHSPDAPSPLTSEDIAARLAELPRRVEAGTLTAKSADELTRLYNTAAVSIAAPDIARIIPILRPLAREYGPVTRLIDHLQNGRWSAANKDLAALARTRHGRTLPFDLADLKAEVHQLVLRDRTLARTADVTERTLARATKKRLAYESRFPSARWDELTRTIARENITARVRETFSTSPDLDSLVRLANESVYDPILLRDPTFARVIRKEQAAARSSWKLLRDSGHDPIFFSRVSPRQAALQPVLRISDTPVTLKSVRARMMDAAPYVEDVGIIVNQQSLDILQRLATEATFQDIATSFGRTRASIVEELTPRLLASLDIPTTASRASRGAAVPASARLEAMIRQRYTPFSEVYGKYGGGGRLGAFAVERADDIFIPKAMAMNIKRMYEPGFPKLTAAFDPVMKAFRTSVLPLAVRWHLNNLIGGMIITAINDPRAFLEMPTVIRQLWGERYGGQHPIASARLMHEGAPPAGLGAAMAPDVRRWDIDAGSPFRDRVAASAQLASGTTLRRLYDAARDSRIARIPEAWKRTVERSYGFNQFVDDLYRSSIGMSQKKRFLARGFSTDAAEAMATQSIRRAFQAWDDMTPMERSVMRSIIPFYGWTAFVTKFALRYPMDHPFRASVLNSIARAELADGMTGLPDYIREMIFLGDPRANSMTKALNVSPFNPFGGVPSVFTIAGFTGQLNPAITGILTSIGVNVQQGGPQLYPELRYDPESGRLVADPGGNVLSNIIGNTIPQLSGVTALLGWNDRFNETLARDPAAAGRMLLSNFGMPILTRDVNVGDALIRAEMARFQDQENARKEALSTGDLSILGDFPGLAAYGEQIRALEQAGQLDQFRPTPGQPGAPSDASTAYALQAAVAGS